MPTQAEWWTLKTEIKLGRLALDDALDHPAAAGALVLELVSLALLAPSNHRDDDPSASAAALLHDTTIPELTTTAALAPADRTRLLSAWQRHAPRLPVQA